MAKGLDRHYGALGARQRALGFFWTAVTWVVAIIIFFPVFWMVLTAFKQEPKAYTDPPTIVFHPTFLSSPRCSRPGFEIRSSIHCSSPRVADPRARVGDSRRVCAFDPGDRALAGRLVLLPGTKLLPYVAAIVPIYIVALHTGLLDNDWALVILYTGFNLPIAVWMIRSFLLEIPREMLEAARMDGAGVWTELTRVILPIALPGIAATALICVIFSWNEFFFAYFLTTTKGPTVPVFLVSFLQSEGEYWASLAAAATLASLPVILAGWIAQKQLVRGLSLGALK